MQVKTTCLGILSANSEMNKALYYETVIIIIINTSSYWLNGLSHGSPWCENYPILNMFT